MRDNFGWKVCSKTEEIKQKKMSVLKVASAWSNADLYFFPSVCVFFVFLSVHFSA